MAVALILVAGVLPMTAHAAVDDSYKYWDQGDSRWGWMSIGGSDTMGRSGCYITAVAKLLVHAGQQLPSNGFTPQTCLEGMKAHDMLTADGLVKYGNFNYSFLPTYGSQLYKENSSSHYADPWDKGRAINEVGGMIRDGYYVIVCVNNKESGNTHYMAVDYVSDDIYVMDNNAVLPLYGTWKYSGGVIDQVKFKYNGPYPYPAANYVGQPFADIQPGLYSLVPMCAPNSQLEAADSMKVQISHATSNISQQWEIEAVGDRYYRLISKKSGWALDVANADATEGANVQYWKWTGNKAQQWGFIDTGDGYYQIATRLNTNLRLDVTGGKDTDGTNVQIWTKHDGPAQKWKLVPVTATPNCDQGHDYALDQSLSTTTETAYSCSQCGDHYTGQYGPAGTARSGSLKSRGGKELGWAITAQGQLSLASSLPQGETVLAACYDDKGIFTGAKLIQSSTAMVKLDPTTPRLKLFWLNSAYSPLSLAHTVWTP